MGKIKSKQVRKAASVLTKEGIIFSESFNKNKKSLSGLTPSKKVRNQVAGLLARNKKRELKQSK